MPKCRHYKKEEEQRETENSNLQNGLAFCPISTSLFHATLWKISEWEGMISYG